MIIDYKIIVLQLLQAHKISDNQNFKKYSEISENNQNIAKNAVIT